MDFPSHPSLGGSIFTPLCLWCSRTVSQMFCWHPSNRQCRPKPAEISYVCVLFVHRHAAASGSSQSLCCFFMQTSVLCDRVSQASFIKLRHASLSFVYIFQRSRKHTAGKIPGHAHIWRQWKAQGRGDVVSERAGEREPGWNGEWKIESERRKKRLRSQDGEKEGGVEAPLLLSKLTITSEGENNLLPGHFSSFVRFVLILLHFH